MKRITFLTLLSALLMIPFSYGQSLTSLEVSSTKTNIDPITSATVIDRGDNMKSTTVIITNNLGQTSGGNDIACATIDDIVENTIWNEYDLDGNFGITADFEVTSVEFGVGAVVPGSSVPLTISIYSNDGVFPGGTWSLQGTAAYSVTDADDNTIVSVPLSATIPAGDNMLYEIYNPDMTGTFNQFRYMTSEDGALDDSWIMAPGCGLTTPATLASIGFGHFIMNVLGDEVVVPPMGNDYYYVNSTVGNPWGQTTNHQAMDLAFGAGNWVQEYFETLDPVAVFSAATKFVFLEGGDHNADELNAFLTANLPALEAWVNAGGKLFINAAPNEGGNINFGFGGSLLNYPGGSSNVTVVDTGHPAFIGPNTPTSAGMTGSSYSHAYVSGTGFTVLVEETGNPGETILVEKAWGSGRVMMGGMTTTNFHDPLPDAFNYRANLLYYMGVGDGPIINCPGDIVADSDPGVCGSVVNFADASAIDPQDGPVATTQTMGPASGTVFPIGDTIIEFSATDLDGNTSTCQFTVTVNDIEDPIAMCQDITVVLDAAGMAVITPADIDAGSTDNCTGFTMALDMSTFDCSHVGENTVELTVTDASGGTDTCTATVTVEDNQVPVIVCKGAGGAGSLATTLAGGNGNFGNMFDVKAISALTINSFDIHGDTGATFDVEVYAKVGTWVGSETTPGDWTLIGTAAGVASLGDGVVTPLNLSLGYAIPAGETHAFYVTPTDFSTGGFNYTNGTTTGNLFSSDANLEFYEGCGSGYPFNGTIFQPRVFNGNIVYEMPATPPLEVVLDADGMATVDAMDLIFSVDDNCSTVATFGSGGGVSGSLTTLFAAGNNGSPGGAVYFDVTVGPSDINLTSIDINTADAGAFTMDVYTLMGTYVGNEGNAAAWGAPDTGAAGTGAGLDTPSNALLDTPITLTAGTTYGMALVLDATHAHHYTNGDGSNENFSNDDLSMQLGAASNAPFDGSPFSPRVFNGTLNYEAGGGPTMDFDCADLGENMVDVTVTDGAGNEATCTATVIVLDETAPVVVCGPVPLLYDTNSVSDSPALAIPDANPAGVTTTVEVTEDFTLTDVNIPVNITHTWRGDLDITVTSPAGTTVVLKTADISDSADDVIVTYDDEGTAGVEALSAFDGESSLGTWTLFVADQFGGDTGTINSWGVEYEYSYPNPETELFIELGPDGTVTIEAEDITSVMEEACGFDVVLLDITEFSCDDIGTPTLVTLFVNDASGNFASCQVEVNIVDAMAPVLTCPDPGMYGTEPSNNDGVYIVRDYYDIGAATYSDNCTEAGSLIVTQTPAPGTAWGINGTGNPGPYEVVFTVEDEYGNISTCTLEVTVTNGIGVTENTLLANALGLYPNPASDQVTLVNTSDIALQTAMIYDLNGKLVADIDLSNMQNETSFDVSDFASGVYMVKIVGENANTVKRLVKK